MKGYLITAVIVVIGVLVALELKAKMNKKKDPAA